MYFRCLSTGDDFSDSESLLEALFEMEDQPALEGNFEMTGIKFGISGQNVSTSIVNVEQSLKGW